MIHFSSIFISKFDKPSQECCLVIYGIGIWHSLVYLSIDFFIILFLFNPDSLDVLQEHHLHKLLLHCIVPHNVLLHILLHILGNKSNHWSLFLSVHCRCSQAPPAVCTLYDWHFVAGYLPPMHGNCNPCKLTIAHKSLGSVEYWWYVLSLSVQTTGILRVRMEFNLVLS